jgi:hypothetical protein
MFTSRKLSGIGCSVWRADHDSIVRSGVGRSASAPCFSGVTAPAVGFNPCLPCCCYRF